MAITKTELLILRNSFFGSREKSESWLRTSILALGNQTPESLLVTDSGIEQVYDCIQRLQHCMTSLNTSINLVLSFIKVSCAIKPDQGNHNR